jgi:hypothetical protein
MIFSIKRTGILTYGFGLAVAATGCGGSPPPPYPSNGPEATSTPDAVPTPVTVPPNAITLATAKYDQVLFKAPAEPGMIYIYDMDASKVVAATNAAGDENGRSMTMTDLKNVTRNLDTSHMYRISFVSSRHSMPMTSAPSMAQ